MPSQFHFNSFSLNAVYWLNNNNFLNPRSKYFVHDKTTSSICEYLVQNKIPLTTENNVSKWRQGFAFVARSLCMVGITVSVSPLGVIVNGSKLVWQCVKAIRVVSVHGAKSAIGHKELKPIIEKISQSAKSLVNDSFYTLFGVAAIGAVVSFMVPWGVAAKVSLVVITFMGSQNLRSHNMILSEKAIPNIEELFIGLSMKACFGITDRDLQPLVAKNLEFSCSMKDEKLAIGGPLFKLYLQQLDAVCYELYKVCKIENFKLISVKGMQSIKYFMFQGVILENGKELKERAEAATYLEAIMKINVVTDAKLSKPLNLESFIQQQCGWLDNRQEKEKLFAGSYRNFEEFSQALEEMRKPAAKEEVEELKSA